MKKRTLANIVLCISVLFFPWYISCALAIFFGCIFPTYVESILWGALVDALYAPGSHNGFYVGSGIGIVSTIIPLVISRAPWHR